MNKTSGEATSIKSIADLPGKLLYKSVLRSLKQKGINAEEINTIGVSENTETSHSNHLVAILSLSLLMSEVLLFPT